GVKSRRIAEILWENMDRYKRRPLSPKKGNERWVIKRVDAHLRRLKQKGFIQVAREEPSGDVSPYFKTYWYRLTKSGENYAEYHYKNHFDDLKVSRRIL
ncbi:hypothetical protein AKJ52_02735, partial [candidate division MSBL1 archaeon SCGC-AAA382C18]